MDMEDIACHKKLVTNKSSIIPDAMLHMIKDARLDETDSVYQIAEECNLIFLPVFKTSTKIIY